MTEKQADAFRTISEAAEELNLPQHVLRFWETRFPQIRPMKRSGGRRYYRSEDVHLLAAIRRLLYDDGYTIKGVQRILKEQGAKAVVSLGQSGASSRPVPQQDFPDRQRQYGEGEDETAAAIPAVAYGSPARPKGASLQDLQALLTVIEGCIGLLEEAEAP